MQKVAQRKQVKISPTGNLILEFLKSRGGTSAVGVIGSNRSVTINHLRRLQDAGLIECLVQPEKFKVNVAALGIEGVSLTCGIWQLAAPPIEEKIRSCDFCEFRAPYSDFPDGSISYQNLIACAPCLKTTKTKHFRALVKGKTTNQKCGISWEVIAKNAS